MAHCTHHSACPVCTRSGNDRNRDNLGVYSDGSKYCFRCGYFETATGKARLTRALGHSGSKQSATRKPITLPPDITTSLPGIARDFLTGFELTENDLKRNTIVWSDKFSRVIFPYFANNGLSAWQGRYLGQEKDKAKWFSQGNLQELLHIVGNQKAKTVVLCEDIISAIKIAKCGVVCASPLFGSHVSVQRMLQLKKNYDRLLIWLDKDVMQKSVKYAQQSRLVGLPCSTIITDLDPKSVSSKQIVDIVCSKL